MRFDYIESLGANSGLGEVRKRVKFVFILICLVFLAVAARDFYLQVITSDELSRKASRQLKREIEIKSRRGTIFDRNHYTLAISLDADSVYAVPEKINDIPKTSGLLSWILSTPNEKVAKKLSLRNKFVWIKRQISQKESEKLRKMKIEGVGFIKESRRFYPQGTLASQLLGFTGIDNEGLEGAEKEFEKYIAGKSGIKVITEHDAKGKSPFVYEKPVTHGDNIVLTIDKNIQHIAQSELEKGVKEARAKNGIAIVVDPRNGDVLAMANYPDFNPNRRSESPVSAWRNRAISDCFEPGSVFKVVFATAALEEKIVSPETQVDCSQGYIVVGGKAIRDSHLHDVLSFTEVIGKSSNVGSIKISQLLGEEKLYEYIKKFGFGDKTGIQLRGEARGILRNTKEWSNVSMGSVTIGQEVAVTPIQLAMAYAAIANGGILYRPRVIEQVERWDGKVKEVFPASKIGRIMSPATSGILTEILQTVVSEEGTAYLAHINGFEVAGKTGTAQKAGPGGYLRGKYYASFIGFVPASAPRLVIAVILNEPEESHYGGTVSAPIFREIAERSLLNLGVKPHFKSRELRLVNTESNIVNEERNL